MPQTSKSDVIRKNKVTDNLDKMELDIDQASMKAFAQFLDKKLNSEHNLCKKSGTKTSFIYPVVLHEFN